MQYFYFSLTSQFERKILSGAGNITNWLLIRVYRLEKTESIFFFVV